MASTLQRLCRDQYANSWNAKTMCACARMKGRLTKTDRFAPSVKCHWFSGGCRLQSARLCDKTDTSALALEVAWCHSLSLAPVIPDEWQWPPLRSTHLMGMAEREWAQLKNGWDTIMGGNVNRGFSGGHGFNWRVMSRQFCLPALKGK